MLHIICMNILNIMLDKMNVIKNTHTCLHEVFRGVKYTACLLSRAWLVLLLSSGTQVSSSLYILTMHLSPDLAEETETHLSNLIPQTQETHILVCFSTLVSAISPGRWTSSPFSRLPCPLETQLWRGEVPASQRSLFQGACWVAGERLRVLGWSFPWW